MTYQEAAKKMTLAEKLGQCFMPAAFINDTEEEVRNIETLIAEHHIGSICFFHSRASAATNFEGKKKVVHNEKSYERLLQLIERYQKAAKYPLLIAIDAEWGLAMRIENTPQYPYALTLGAMQNRADLVFEVGRQIGMDCRKAGIHWNLAPVVDINLNPENPVIGYRSFGADREKVTEYACAYLDGMKSVGILNSVKHFPGHGDTAVDSHLGLPKIDKDQKTLLQQELYPFKKLIAHGVDSVMVGHLAVPALSGGKSISASISKEIITDFLRKELKYKGLIISDALNMHAISKDFSQEGDVEYQAFAAGNDVLCFADNVEAGIKKIMEHAAPHRIESSFERIWKLKQKAFSVDGHDTTIPKETNLNHQLAKESLTFLKGAKKDLDNFRKSGFHYVQFGDAKNNFFASELQSYQSNPNSCVLGIFPPNAKPKGNFGFTDMQIDAINRMVLEKDCVLYLFGNPFFLNLLDWQKAQAVIVVYQDFKEFQEVTLQHFLGKLDAKGKLPVTLNVWQNG